MTKDRESSRTPCPFAMLKILSQKTNTFTSEYLLTQPYEKNYFSACPPAVVGQFIFRYMLLLFISRSAEAVRISLIPIGYK